jgi:hypothetical protein
MRTTLTRLAVGAGLLLALTGCGSGADTDEAEAERVLGEIKSLKEGEILIRGMTAPRVIGPYTFKPGGYVFRFEQAGSNEGDRRMVVVLESRPNSRRDPYQRLVDTRTPSGSAKVVVSGKLYVNVLSADGEYVLRFTPKRKRG